jgi:hypothetical protein
LGTEFVRFYASQLNIVLSMFFNFENEPILTSKMHPPLPIVPKN